MTPYKCFFCDGKADRIAFYSKSYPNKAGYTIENPTICCSLCYKSPQIINQISPIKSGDMGIFSFKFDAIGKWTNKELGFYLSKKKWDVNHLAVKPMKKLIWRLHYLNLSKEKLNDNN